MSKPNWNEAPGDATHWGPETNDFNESWYKKDGESWSCVSVHSLLAFNSPWYGLGLTMARRDLESRP